MKLIIDAQLPKRLKELFLSFGYDAIHTLDLPDKNNTIDLEIISLAAKDNRVVVTKDADFVHSFLFQNRPFKLLLVSTGNIANHELLDIFSKNHYEIKNIFDTHHFVEITKDSLITHK
ncbi:MAG: DUF5615 family PIN-like protein [bacterium]